MALSPADLVCTVERRNPFRLAEMPLLARLQAAAQRRRRRVAKRLVGKPATYLFHAARRLGIGRRGTFALALPEGEARFAFDARNMQFGALYLPGGGTYEPELCALIDLLLADEEAFFDVGANWGYFALYALSRPGYAGAVHAFEPYPPSFEDLAALAAQSPFGERFVCHAEALSNRDGPGRIGVPGGMLSGIARLGAEEAAHEIAVRRLDGLGLPDPGFIKFDVEGHEAEALDGARETLARARPYVVFESWVYPTAPAATLDPFEILAGLGYRFFVPAWLEEANGRPVPRAGPTAPPAGKLALIETRAAERFLLGEQLNLLACPEDRMAEMGARLGARTP